METIRTINLESPAYLEAKGLAKVWEAYAEKTPNEDIMEVGFNANSGYVYIALENGITLGSLLGGDVEYIVYDYEIGEETFYDVFEDIA